MARKLKVGVIGTGVISGFHLAGYVKSGLAEVYALADVDAGALTSRGDEYCVPPERRFKDYRRLLAIEQLDAVSVCTPNIFHCRQTIAALNAGKHVLCEKPMAMTPAEAKRMVTAAEQTGRKLQIGLHHRFRNDAVFVHKLVTDGKLGDIYFARCQAIRRRGVPSWGVFGQADKQGGGGLIDIGVHQIDLTWWLMGKPTPISVTGQTYRTIGDKPGRVGMFGRWDHRTYTVEDFACGLVRFGNGAAMSIECGFNVNLDAPREGCHIAGTKGGAGLSPLSVQIDLNGHITDCTPRHVNAADKPNPLGDLNDHEKEVAAFCRSVTKDKPVPVPGSEAIWTQRIIDGLYRSAESGRGVTL